MTDPEVKRSKSVLDRAREHEAGRHDQFVKDCALCERNWFELRSDTLNTVAWTIGVALGDVVEGDTELRGDPIEWAERLVDKLAEAKRLLEDAQEFLAGETETSERDLAEWFLDAHTWANEARPGVTEVVEVNG